MQSVACLNGEIMPVEEARVPVWDRGFLFGDAVYELYRLYDGRCWLEEAHTARLARSLRAMEFPTVDLDQLRRRIRDTIAASGVKEGTVYIQISRGVAQRKHAFPAPGTPPTELIVVSPYDDGPTEGRRQSGITLISYPDLRWKRCDVKSVNLLANCIANEHAHRAGAYEAVLVDSHGNITEATHSSVLWIRQGRLGGTPEGNEILPGTTRGRLLQTARSEDVPFEPGPISLDNLKVADEVFLLGTTIEVLPVVKIDDITIGDGHPGPVTRRLQKAFRRAIEEWLAEPSELQ